MEAVTLRRRSNRAPSLLRQLQLTAGGGAQHYKQAYSTVCVAGTISAHYSLPSLPERRASPEGETLPQSSGR